MFPAPPSPRGSRYDLFYNNTHKEKVAKLETTIQSSPRVLRAVFVSRFHTSDLSFGPYIPTCLSNSFSSKPPREALISARALDTSSFPWSPSNLKCELVMFFEVNNRCKTSWNRRGTVSDSSCIFFCQLFKYTKDSQFLTSYNEI